MPQQLPVDISTEWTVSGLWFRNLLDTAVALGCDRTRVVKQAGLRNSVLDNLEQQHPLAELIQLAGTVQKLSGKSDIGIRYIIENGANSGGLVGLAAATAPTLQAAWETVSRYRHLVQNTGNTRLFDQGETVIIRWYPYSRSIVSSRFLVDALVSGWIIHSCRITGRDIKPLSVSLSYPRPIFTALFKQTYGTQVLFGQTYNSAMFRREDMAATLHYADSKIHQLLCSQAEKDIVQLEANSSYAETVEYEMKRQLPQGCATIEIIASKMHTTARTLQRHLAYEGTSFKELLNNVRHELALLYLNEPTYSTLDIALKLGYNHASSFCTAFKGWTGMSPSKYRET